jgi:hypothetical protein
LFLVGWIIQPAARGSSLFAGGRSQVSLSCLCSVSVVCAPWSCFWCSAVATEDGDLELLLKTKWGRAAGILWSQLLFLSSSFVLCSFRSLMVYSPNVLVWLH